MKKEFLADIPTHITTFWDRTSGKWFYYFAYNWTVYRGNHGYETRKEAEEAAFKHAREVDQ